MAVKLFNPKLISIIKQRVTFHKITASSESPKIKVSLVNERYLNEKLSKLDFWGYEKATYVNDKQREIQKVTVDRLSFIITDKLQPLGRRTDTKPENDEVSENNVLYSYGQLYDPSTKTMPLLLHLNPSFKSARPLRDSYTALALFALFDTIHPMTPGGETTSYKSLALFMPEYVEKPGKNYIFKINED